MLHVSIPEVPSSGSSYEPFNWCVLNVLYGVSPASLLVLQLFKSVVHLLLLQLFRLDSLWVGKLGYICQTVGMFLFFVPPERLCLSRILALWNLSIHNFSTIDVLLLSTWMLDCGFHLLGIIITGMVIQQILGLLLAQFFKWFWLIIFLVQIIWCVYFRLVWLSCTVQL